MLNFPRLSAATWIDVIAGHLATVVPGPTWMQIGALSASGRGAVVLIPTLPLRPGCPLVRHAQISKRARSRKTRAWRSGRRADGGEVALGARLTRRTPAPRTARPRIFLSSSTR